MESRICIFLLTAACALLAGGCSSRALDKEAEADQARPVIDPEVARRDVKAPHIDTPAASIGR